MKDFRSNMSVKFRECTALSAPCSTCRSVKYGLWTKIFALKREVEDSGLRIETHRKRECA